MRHKRAARKRVNIEFDAEPSTWNDQVPAKKADDVLLIDQVPAQKADDILLIDQVPAKIADDVSTTVPKRRKLDVAIQQQPPQQELQLQQHSADDEAESLIVPKNNWNTKQKVNLYSKAKVINIINEKLTAKQKEIFRKGCFGHLLDFKIEKFPSQLIHHLILRQCPQAKKNELWFDIEGTIVKFGMKEFALITGLNCNNYPFIFEKKLPESTTKRKFFKKGKSVQRFKLNDVFRANKGGNDEDIVKLAKLYCLESLLIPKKLENNIDPNHLKMVDNPELFDNYPWGRLSYEMTIAYIKRSIKSQEAEAYGIGGFPYAVIVWAYETMPILIKKNFTKKIRNGMPRIINWEADQQPSFREITDRVFDSLELEVYQIVPSKEEMEQPYMAPFRREKKKELNGVEEEKYESEPEDVILMPAPIRQVRKIEIGNQVRRIQTENQGELDQEVKNLMCKVERMEKTQLEMKKDMEEMYTMLLEIHGNVVDQPSYFVGKYSNREKVHAKENNDKIMEDRNKKMGENDGEKNDEEKDDKERVDGHNDKVIEDVNEIMESREREMNGGLKEDTRMEDEKDNENLNEDENEKMDDQEIDKGVEDKDRTGKEDEAHNDKVMESVNEKMQNKEHEKNGEQKDATGQEDKEHNDKVNEDVDEKMENKDGEKHGEQKEDTGMEGEKVNCSGNEKVEDK